MMYTGSSYNKLMYSGISGLQLPIPKYLFPDPYKDASRLTYYASFFNSIEINSSFYKIPLATTMAKWAATVPDNFKFTFKLWQGITHNKGLEFNEDHVHTFLKSINAVEEKKGCLLIQFPPSLGGTNLGQLKHLLHCIKEAESIGWKIAVEFRNTSWYQEHVYDILQDLNAAMVVQDIPKSATPAVNHPLDFIYLRFHGPTGNYRESYSADFLNDYANAVNDWIEEGKTVYVYFNNTMGDAFNNLKYLNALIQDNTRVT